MWNRNKRIALILFLLIMTLAPPSLYAQSEAYEPAYDEIQVCNSAYQDRSCQERSCIDQCLKEEGVDAEECRMSCNIST